MSWNYQFALTGDREKKTKCLNLVADDDDDNDKLRLQTVKNIYVEYTYIEEPGSSVSIVSDYGLDDRTIGVRSPAGAKDFSSILCPDRLWGPPSLLYNGYRGSFPRG
jgi:hypothetical protein